MIANIYPFKYTVGGWTHHYTQILKVLHSLGYTNKIGTQKPKDDLEWLQDMSRQGVSQSFRDWSQLDLENGDVNIFNHCIAEDLQKEFNLGHNRNIIVKPTGPTKRHFTLDLMGYASYSSICYKEPCLDNIDPTSYYNKEVRLIVSEKSNKWGNAKVSHQNFTRSVRVDVKIPENHILILGQKSTDEVVTRFSFGNHHEKLLGIIETAVKYTTLPIVVREHPLHPFPRDMAIKLKSYKKVLLLKKHYSIHDILPKTKVAILENSTAGLECLMHDVPIISYGYPEYHWVTYDLRHLVKLPHAIETIDSWWDKDKARKWLTWYATQYACNDYVSTKRRLLTLLEEIKNIS